MNFHAMGASGREVDQLALFLVIATAVLMALVLGLMLTFAFRYRAGRAADRAGRKSSSWKIEAGAAAAMLALGMISFAWGGRIYVRQYAAPPGALDIYVLGKRWMWTFQYADGRTADIGVLEVPIHRPVRLLLTSDDVIHSFYAPELRIKQDAVPGRYTSLTFTPDELGDFTILCSEFCGTDHSGMRATLRVVTPERFALDQRSPAGRRPDGEKLYHRLECATCHETGGRLAPRLAGLFGTVVRLDDGRTMLADEDYLRRSLTEPARDVVAGYRPIMPTYRGLLSEPELAALLEYLKRLPGKETP